MSPREIFWKTQTPRSSLCKQAFVCRNTNYRACKLHFLYRTFQFCEISSLHCTLLLCRVYFEYVHFNWGNHFRENAAVVNLRSKQKQSIQLTLCESNEQELQKMKACYLDIFLLIQAQVN